MSTDLKTNSSPGPGGLEAKFVISAAHVLMYPLADLFDCSLSTCFVPSIWKCARVISLFKDSSVILFLLFVLIPTFFRNLSLINYVFILIL